MAPGAEESYLVPSRESRISVRLPKGRVVPITATAVWRRGPATVGSETLRPAGAIWPHSAEPYDASSGLRIKLTYDEGFPAWIMASVVRAGADAQSFNTGRFLAELNERGENLHAKYRETCAKVERLQRENERLLNYLRNNGMLHSIFGEKADDG